MGTQFARTSSHVVWHNVQNQSRPIAHPTCTRDKTRSHQGGSHHKISEPGESTPSGRASIAGRSARSRSRLRGQSPTPRTSQSRPSAYGSAAPRRVAGGALGRRPGCIARLVRVSFLAGLENGKPKIVCIYAVMQTCANTASIAATDTQFPMRRILREIRYTAPQRRYAFLGRHTRVPSIESKRRIAQSQRERPK